MLCHLAEYRIVFYIMLDGIMLLNVIILSVDSPNVIMLSVYSQNVIMLTVVAPLQTFVYY